MDLLGGEEGEGMKGVKGVPMERDGFAGGEEGEGMKRVKGVPMERDGFAWG